MFREGNMFGNSYRSC